MIYFKKGVDYSSLNPILWDWLKVLNEELQEVKILIIIVTSISDGKHGDDSRHYKGMALDLRKRIYIASVKELIIATVAKIKKGIPHFNIIQFIEEPDHFHVEMDSKQGQVD